MGVEETGWRSLLRELDQTGWDIRRDFDAPAVKARLADSSSD